MLPETLGHYRILRPLGKGGMGEVYAAQDTRLGRSVALKVLPQALAADPTRRERFEREARTVAALNHPHIVTIHSVEEAEGVPFLTMELIEGRRLSELIPIQGMALERFLQLSVPLADAVSAAHKRGIVHRDLKPANVMVTEEGQLKVLDFGLAKLKEAAHSGEELNSDLATWEQTGEGRIVGTAAYMSPEQAEGKPVDARSDVFSLGIVIYEMTTGRRPFQGDSSAGTLSAILKDTPVPVSELRPELPTEVGRIIRRCLEKDPARRMQTALDLRNELEDLKKDSDSGQAVRSAPSMAQPTIRRRKRVLTIASLAGILLVGGVAYLQWLRRDPVPVLSNPVQVTRAVGAEEYPTWSPEGGRLAYHLNTKGDETSYDIWVAQVNGGQAVNLTADHPGTDQYPGWSPDGSQIAFWSDRQGGGHFVMSALGGPARKVAGGPPPSDSWWWWWATRPQWSPNGQELASVVYEQEAVFLQIVSLASGTSRQLPLPGAERGPLDQSWSPDGRYFAYLGAPLAQRSELRVLRVGDQKTFVVTGAGPTVSSPSWSSDGRYLYFVSDRGGSMDLWRQRMRDARPDGDSKRVTTGIGMTSAVFSRDGKRLAYSRGRTVGNVWRVPILKERPATWADAQQITFEEALVRTLAVSRDGRHLLVSSDRAGNPDLWMLPVEGGEMQQVTTHPTGDEHPAWSPDGAQIAFNAYRSGNWQVWVQPVSGGPARQLTKGEGENGMPAWSPDGQSILFASRRGGNEDIWSVPATGGEARQLTTHPKDDRMARWSPDGKWLVFYSTRSGYEGLWRAGGDGGAPELLVELGGAPNWSSDGKWIYYLSFGKEPSNVWAVAVDGRTKRPMTDLRGRRGLPGSSQSALAADAMYLYFIWQEDLGDIWVADVTYPRPWD